MLQAPCVGSSRVAVLLIFCLVFGFFVPECRLCFAFRERGGKGGLQVSFLSAWRDLGGVLSLPAAALREARCSGRSPGAFAGTRAHPGSPWQEKGKFRARLCSVGGSDVHKQRLGAFINFPL